MTQPCVKEAEIKEIRDMAIETRTDFKYIKESIKNIETNHLKHMQSSLENMEDKINVNQDEFQSFKFKTLAWGSVGAFIGSLIIQLVFRFIK